MQTIDADQLPPGDITVDIHWSSLNYKDALAITGKGKNHPQLSDDSTASISPVPFIQAKIRASTAGQKVLLTGWGVGETTGAVWPNVRG